MIRNGNSVSICIWYEMAMVRNGYGTKMIFTMVRNGKYEMVMVRNDCNSKFYDTGSSLFLEAIFKKKLVKDKL